jgi:Protein of unknown function (DUF3095)
LLIVAPRGDEPRFATLVQDIMDLALATTSSDRPIALTSLKPGDPAKAITLETAVKTSAAPRALAFLAAAYNYLGTRVFFGLGLKGPGVPARIYKSDLVANADFRKFDDGLRMTLDCSADFADKLESLLAAAEDFANWGEFRQEAAQVTCFTPSVTERGHVHFVDGVGGGYTMAAKAMKARRDALASAP